jgi:predicted nucleic acid-binding protein
MIVADASLLGRLVINGPDTSLAQAVLLQDGDWIAPGLLKSELRNVLLKYIRAKQVDLAKAEQILDVAFDQIASFDDTASDLTLATAVELKISTYDAEYVSLAQDQNVPLITFDQKLIRAARGIAISAADFLA